MSKKVENDMWLIKVSSVPALKSNTTAPSSEDQLNKKPVSMRFDPTLLAKIDEDAKKRCLSRNGLVSLVMSDYLEERDNRDKTIKT